MITTAARAPSFSIGKKIVLVVFSLILFYFGVRLIQYHYLLVTFPYQLENSEGTMLLTTDLLLKGENPYALRNMPVAMNVYGIGYHLLVYPFARLWGPTLLVHRALSAFFILLACLLFFIVLRRHGINKLYSASAALILYASLLYRYTSTAKPDGLGFFLFLLSVFIVYLMQYSTWSLVISVLLGILAFYTKAYFILSIPYLVTYLFLFVSKKKAILYGALAISLFVITALIVNQVYETYFVNTFFNHINVATNDMQQLWAQLQFFSMYNSGVILILVLYAALFLLDKLRDRSLPRLKFQTVRRKLQERVDILHSDRAFVQVPFSLAWFCLILSSGIFYFKMGRHYGNIMTYAYQLITPFFLLCTYRLIDLPLKDPGLAQRRDNYNYVLLLPCILVSLYLLWSSATSLSRLPEWVDSGDWQRMEQITRSHNNILNSAMIASLLIEQNKPVYDTGQTEFFQYSHYPSGWLEGLLLPNADVSKRWSEYEDTLRSAVAQEKFDAIIIAPREHRAYLKDLEQHYLMVDEIGLCIFHTAQCAELEIWEPRTAPSE
jgi:hypothetical protein